MATRRRKAAGLALLLAILLLGWQGLGLLDGNPDSEGDGEGERGAQALTDAGAGGGVRRQEAPDHGAEGPGVSGRAEGAGGARLVGAGEDRASADPASRGGVATDTDERDAPPEGGVPRAGDPPTGTRAPGDAPADPAVAADPDPRRDSEARPDRTATPDPTAALDPDATPDPERGVRMTPFIPDRADGLLQVIRSSAARGLIAEGHVAADALASMALPEDWRERRREALTALEHARADRLDALGEALQQAEGFAAQALIAPLWTPPHPEAATALREFCERQGWPLLVGPADRAEVSPKVVGPAGDGGDGGGEGSPVVPLARRRAVVWRADGADPVRARIVETSGGMVTLEVHRGGRVTFPTARRTEVVPVDPGPEDLVQQGLAHCAVGEPHVARLWLVAALLRGAGGPALEALRSRAETR